MFYTSFSSTFGTKTGSVGPVATYSISQLGTTMAEGGTNIFSVTTTNVTDGTILYWTTTGTTSAADFFDNTLTGTVTITGNYANITRKLLVDTIVDNNETFAIEIRTGSTSGTIVATSATVTVSNTAPSTVKTLVDNLTASTWNTNAGMMDYNSTADSYITVYPRIPTGTSAYQLVVTKFTASTNTKLWSKQIYTSQASWYALPLGARLNNNGEVAVYYRAATSSTYSLFVSKFASDGTNNWNKKITSATATGGFNEWSNGYFSGHTANQGFSWIGSDLILTNAFSNSASVTNGGYHFRLNGSTGAVTWSRQTYKSYVSGSTYYLAPYKTITASTPDGTKAIHAWQGQINGTYYSQSINIYVGATGGQLSPSSLTYRAWTQSTLAKGVEITGIVADNSYVYCAGTNWYSATSGTSYDIFLMAVSLTANSVAWNYKLSSNNVPASGSFSIVPILRSVPGGGFLTYARTVATNLTYIVQKWSSNGQTIDWAYTVSTTVGIIGGMAVDTSGNLLVEWISKTSAPASMSVITVNNGGGSAPFTEGTYVEPNNVGTITLTRDASATSSVSTNPFVAISTNSFTDTTVTLTVANPTAAEVTMQTVTANVIVT